MWEGPRQQIFCGASGSGKTILLRLKALECIKKQEPVIIFVPRPLDSLYRGFFKKNAASSSMYNIVCTQEELRKQANESHIFVDEFQAFCDTSVTFRLTAIPAVEFIGGKQAAQSYRWISYDWRQSRPIGDGRLFHSITALVKEYRFKHAYLATVMRNSLEVYEFVERYIMKNSRMNPSSNILKLMGSEQSRTLLDHPHLGHQVSGPAVSICTRDGVEEACELICSEVKDYAKEGA